MWLIIKYHKCYCFLLQSVWCFFPSILQDLVAAEKWDLLDEKVEQDVHMALTEIGVWNLGGRSVIQWWCVCSFIHDWHTRKSLEIFNGNQQASHPLTCFVW